ncbi:hypothetical protein BKI52_38865 [marine bacterium AO1-C]|nr:hypothetical protein BKI52_38865 [marine bacterium AO1-C]
MEPEKKWAGLELYYLTIDTKLLPARPNLPESFFDGDNIVAVTIAEQRYVQENGLDNRLVLGYIQPHTTDITEESFIAQSSFIQWILVDIVLQENFSEQYVMHVDHANYDNNRTEKVSDIKGPFSMDVIDDRVPHDQIPTPQDKYGTVHFEDGKIVKIVGNEEFRLVSRFGEPCFTTFGRDYLRHLLLEMGAISE